MKYLREVIVALTLLLAAVGHAAEGDGKAAAGSILIDVRTSVEWQSEHLEGALNIPYDKIAEKIGQAVPDKKTKVILYCRTGRRSGIALETLKKIGYEDVTNLINAKEASEKLKIPIIKGDK